MIRYRAGRAVCSRCGRVVACYSPRGGDGSAMRLRKHKHNGDMCDGSYDIVSAGDIVKEPFSLSRLLRGGR